MVQLKYFGDSRDYFKYDLITAVVRDSSIRNYVFVPMLTKHRDDMEGRKTPIDRGCKSQDLLSFISQCSHKSLTHWERWLRSFVDLYATVEPVDDVFFLDEKRASYWSTYLSKISQEHALVFVDPDTGLETGTPSYLRKKGRDKYILNEELSLIVAVLDVSSVLMIYQHLPNDKRRHQDAIEKKLSQVRSHVAYIHACAYREDDLAFICISKSEARHDEVAQVLARYHDNSTHKYKSLHGIDRGAASNGAQ